MQQFICGRNPARLKQLVWKFLLCLKVHPLAYTRSQCLAIGSIQTFLELDCIFNSPRDLDDSRLSTSIVVPRTLTSGGRCARFSATHQYCPAL